MRKFKNFFEDYRMGHNPYGTNQNRIGAVTEEKKPTKSIDDLESALDQEIGKVKDDIQTSEPSKPDVAAPTPADAAPVDPGAPTDPSSTDPNKQDIAGPQPIDTEAAAAEMAENPVNKIEQMFTDTGDVNVDYSLTNENNISLAVFKFIEADVDPEKLVPKEDLDPGMPVFDMEQRLTPEQRDLYSYSNKQLRVKYPAIDKREKYIIIHNTNIPMHKKNEQGEDVTVPKSQLPVAYEKVNAYMEKKFGLGWQDKNKARTFLKSIKINFSDKPYVRMNVAKITEAFPADTGEPILYYGKLMIENPNWLEEFVSKNKNDELFKASSIFRSISNSYNNQEGDSVCVIITTKIVKDFSPSEEEPSSDNTSDDAGEDSLEPDAPADEEANPDEDKNSTTDTEQQDDIEGEAAEPTKADEEVEI